MRRKIAKNLILSSSSVFLMFIVQSARAENRINITEGSSMTTFPQLVERLLNNYIGFVGLAAFVAIVVGGFTYLMAGANTDRAQRAKKILMYAIIGMFLAVLSYALFRIFVTMLNDVF